MAAVKIKPVPGYKAQPGPGGPGIAVPKPKPAPKYNPQAYVPGGSSPAVAKAIQTQGKLGVGTPLPKIQPYQMPATVPTTAGTATAIPKSAVPSNYIASLDEIMGHPLSEQARGQYNTQMQSLMTALQSNLGQAVIKGGYDPTAAFQKLLADRPDLAQFSGLLRQSDIAEAAANPLSERAMAEQGYNRGLENQNYELAARGMGGSGAAATGTNALLQNRQMQEQQTRDALLQAISGGITGYLGQQTEGYNSLLDKYGEVAQLLAQQPGGPLEEGSNDVEDVENAAAISGQGGLVPGTNIPNAAQAPVNGLPWFGTTIHSVQQMRQELGRRGLNWDTWAKQHPNQARLLEGLSY